MHVGKHILHINRTHIQHNNIKKCVGYTSLFEGKRAELQKQNHRGPHLFGIETNSRLQQQQQNHIHKKKTENTI